MPQISGVRRQSDGLNQPRPGKNEIWYNTLRRRTGMPRLMEKKDWMQTVADVGSADGVWYENVSVDGGQRNNKEVACDRWDANCQSR